MTSSRKYLENLEWFKYNVNGCQYDKCKADGQWIDPPHHIIFKSEIPKHPKRDCKSNLIQLCNKCHNKFHGKFNKGETRYSKHEMRKDLIVERELDKLFNLKGAIQ